MIERATEGERLYRYVIAVNALSLGVIGTNTLAEITPSVVGLADDPMTMPEAFIVGGVTALLVLALIVIIEVDA